MVHCDLEPLNRSTAANALLTLEGNFNDIADEIWETFQSTHHLSLENRIELHRGCLFLQLLNDFLIG
jgi:hypothetical protein